MTHRLPPQASEWIDRSRRLGFRFEGRSYTGFAGDTITSALAANGVRLLGRSFKYHRARGVYSLANHDVNALMEDRKGGRTNLRADVTPLAEGMALSAVNTFGGLRQDRARLLDWFGRFLPVGFYYKTFYKPRRLFPFYERRMRELAGLGAVDPRRPRVSTAKAYDFCDVLVVGAGPAGLSAAIAAAEASARVVVVDENPRPGGSFLYQWSDQPEARALATALLERAAALPNLEIRPATVAAGAYADFWVALVDDLRLVKLRARSVIIASGCIAQPAVFGNNDLPGVMLATAAQRLVHLYAVKPFDRGVVLAANAEGYQAALDLHRAGVPVAAVIDLRPGGEPSAMADEVRTAGIAIHAGHAVSRALPGPGRAAIRGVEVAPLDDAGRVGFNRAFELPCDGLIMSVGWAPADGLFYQAGGRMTWSESLQQFVPRSESTPAGLFAAGRLNGVYPLQDQLADGRRAGQGAAAYLGLTRGDSAPAPSSEGTLTHHGSPPPSHPYPVFPHPTAKSFVDLDEDVQYKDIIHAVQEGFDHVELLKRYATLGMGPTQGKLANMNAIRILSQVKGQTVLETGVTTSRPFYHPVPLGHLAGRGFHPHRLTALHSRHLAAGAVWMPAGDWQRPAYYAATGRSREESIAEEVLAVRSRVGLIDVSTLGKLEISGPDAGAFIERVYTGRFASMAIGTTRYGLMCDESGTVIDDGVVARLAEDRYYVTTTTTGSGAVYRELQRWAILWGLPVVLTNATGSLAAINLAGPQAREVLRPLCDSGLDLSAGAFPYLGVRAGRLLGVPARLLRVGFVGELGYEIHIPAYSAGLIWDRLLEAGRSHQIRPFGVEAQRVLRLEKGHVIIGQDTDGLTHPVEAGLGWAVKRDKPFFVGQRSLAILGT
ncbi:MAG TPA: 2Fe-2S iron-sulfur cluster-binding protein, partial [Isosphaeraceae bacterium]|nr:2Fe-2S iron-sulfur cluster-binding protein [Isosphaeraceae bacterium]